MFIAGLCSGDGRGGDIAATYRRDTRDSEWAVRIVQRHEMTVKATPGVSEQSFVHKAGVKSSNRLTESRGPARIFVAFADI